jgi:hypothetical protein
MSGSAERIRARLPSLWRPEPETVGLFPHLLAAAGRLVDRLDVEASDLLQALWFGTADAAAWSRFFHRRRALAAAPAAEPPVTADELEAFPYLDDLPRLGSLLGLLPWTEPFPQRTTAGGSPSLRPESVEHYRERLARIVALYKNGVGTVAALRGIAEVELPVDLLAPEGLKDRPVEIVELAAGPPVVASAAGRGAPKELVGPLMRFPVRHDGVAPAPITWIVEGQEPVAGEVDPTERPLLELFAAGGGRVRRGLGYGGTLDPGQALRVRPAHSSWLAEADGVVRATSRPRGEIEADPVAPGPWQPSAAAGAAPAGVRAFALGGDGFLWAAAGPELWRFGADGWTRIVQGLPELHCLAADGARLLLGTERGLSVGTLAPAPGEEIRLAPAPADLAGPAVFALERASDGAWWAGTRDGAARLGPGDTLNPFGLGAAPETRTPIFAVHEDRGGVLFFGGALGLFQFQPGSGDWWWYAGGDPSESASAWRPFFPDKDVAERGFPTDAEIFLPPVRAIRRGPDATLWLGTEAGLARYGARSSGGTAFAVALEALPALGIAPVHALAEDERGGLWAATESGLFRHDGRDLWQRRGENLERLALSSARSADLWRFDRASDRWQRRDPAVRPVAWRADATAPVAAEGPVFALAWSDGAAAELGTLVAGRFVVAENVLPAAVESRLRARWKPDEERIADGGIPALPRLPVGVSTWRYLAIEGAPPAFESLPAWTREGRLVAPPAEPQSVEEGRWSAAPDEIWSDFDEAAFAYPPAARVSLSYSPRGPLAVIVRLGTLSPDETLDPALLDRVYRGLEQVRPAGVRVLLAVNDEIVRGR